MSGARLSSSGGLSSTSVLFEASWVPALRPPSGADNLRRHVDQQREYYRWALAGDGIRVPIIERSLGDMDFYLTCAALRQAIVMARIKAADDPLR